ncbi:hypothetical protein [Bradyrhizobium liaoningense]|uniref:hypothetical protein n=1 Tax=Bradyrhizobium liaoningense TaxID=43992 RepID=UPI001BA4FD62|nr:hypothetical protein [Bradyrhizobium liaoningense]MBR0941567.1 hypothetical protein [Bradyrhizobium liaoningense]
MAQVDRSHIRKGGEEMSLNAVPSQVPRVRKAAPVRVKLERINCDVAKSLPPEGDHKVWFARLMDACGSSSPDFINATLFQLQAAARLPNSGLSETALNAALAMIESEQPRGETECALVIQMAAVHAASMAVLGRLGGGHGGDRHVLAAATAVSRLSRTFAILVETLRRLRSGGSQLIRIERVDVRDGGQAVIGNIRQKRSHE